MAAELLTDLSGAERLRVVGTPHYQPALAALAGPKRAGGVAEDVRVRLVPEPTNPHDPDAIAVVLRAGADTLGYLAREDARAYGPRVREIAARSHVAVVDAVVLGGDADRNSLFVLWLHIAAP